MCESAGEEIEILGSICSCRFNLDMTEGNNNRKLSIVPAKPNNEHHPRYLLCFTSFKLCILRLQACLN